MAVQARSNRVPGQQPNAQSGPHGLYPNPPTHLPAALVHVTAILCLGLFLEVVAAMRPLLTAGGNPWAWLPVVFLPLAFALTLLVEVVPSPPIVRAFGAAMGLAFLIGVLGTIFHLAAHGLLGPRWGRWLQFGSWLGDPPVFAPMSFALLAVIGASAIASPRFLAAPSTRVPWALLGVAHGPWRSLAAILGGMTLMGIALVASPGRAVGVLIVLAGAIWQGVLLFAMTRPHAPLTSGSYLSPESEKQATPAD